MVRMKMLLIRHVIVRKIGKPHVPSTSRSICKSNRINKSRSEWLKERTNVEKFRVTAFVDHHVISSEVTVCNSGCVQLIQRANHIDRNSMTTM